MAAVALAFGLMPSAHAASRPPASIRTLVATDAAAGPLAGPKAPPGPTSLEITGKEFEGKLVLEAAVQRQLFDRMLSEVSWLSGARSQTVAPPANRLGPKYTVTVLVKGEPFRVFELFPLAKGGPRAHRPGRQPEGKSSDAWFYGRLSMRESLRASGVPLEPKPDVLSGGIGGGIGQQVEVEELDAAAGVDALLTEMRELLMLNGAVVVLIMIGLGSIAFLIRRKV
ncbi:hypothetical protein [Krasilnikovia cinnamomea]|uniref:hypothetical protein n=1 Tax=Krasilnikovia cinnamomea TaxID=349313 RepID=UPI001F5E82B6|nr:hypothetical protein [Krasilnikovia cinnamomea]